MPPRSPDRSHAPCAAPARRCARNVAAAPPRRHQADRVTRGAKHTTEVMCPAACFHRHNASRQAADEIRNAVTTKAPTQNNGASLVEPDEAAHILAKIHSKTSIDIGPFLSRSKQKPSNRSLRRGASDSIITSRRQRESFADSIQSHAALGGQQRAQMRQIPTQIGQHVVAHPLRPAVRIAIFRRQAAGPRKARVL